MYNRYLATLGGGEKHSLAIAEYLSQWHNVEVISHKDVSKEVAAERLNLDLSRVKFVRIPERHPREITPLTAEYDFFFNVSDMTYFPSFAPLSVILVYFPRVVYPPWSKSLRWRLKMALRDWFSVPAFSEGFHGVEIRDGLLVWPVEFPFTMRLPPRRKDYRVSFALRSKDVYMQRAILVLNGEEVQRVDLPPDGSVVHCELIVPGSRRTSFHEVTVKGKNISDALDGGDADELELTALTIDLPQHHLYRLFFERLFKSAGKRLYYDVPKTWILEYLDTYDAIWANSEFTRKWIKRYWGLESETLYPPVDGEKFKCGVKRDQILSVGRFFAGWHNKKHLVLIEAFKGLVDQGLRGWELHLAGGLTCGKAHQEYLQQVYQAAEGYPIFIHVDIQFDELVRLYSESTIFWHATGYGEDEERDPLKLEHLGITTIEALASGCVPVVIEKGGQPEIVQHGVNGFLWQTTEELKAFTMQLIRNPSLVRKMAASAIRSSQQFDKAHFQRRLEELLFNVGL